MAGTILFSTNCWLAHDIAVKYRKGIHFAWVCEHYDARTAPVGSLAAAIAPSSSPKEIYDILQRDSSGEDGHSDVIKRLRKTFKRLAVEWRDDQSITHEQHDEIIAVVNSRSWKIWRPVLYVIPMAPIVATSRLVQVPRKGRAAHGPESQIKMLADSEFDIIER
jgi:hypothetical protein